MEGLRVELAESALMLRAREKSLRDMEDTVRFKFTYLYFERY